MDEIRCLYSNPLLTISVPIVIQTNSEDLEKDTRTRNT